MAEDVTVGRLELLGRRAFIPDIEIIQTEYIEGYPEFFTASPYFTHNRSFMSLLRGVTLL
jgi:hypothetical protein